MSANTRIPARFPLRSGDKSMIMGAFNDKVLRAVVTLDGHTDVALLARALRLSLDASPVAGCRLSTPRHGRPCFERLTNLDALQLLEVFTVADEAASAAALERWALLPVEPHEGPMLRVGLFRTPRADTLCLRIYHLLGDGVAALDYLAQLSDIYAALEHDPAYRPTPNVHGDRGYWQVLRRLSFAEWCKGLGRPTVPLYTGEQWRFPQAQRGTGPGRLVTRELAPGRLATVRAYARAHGATVNDVLLAAWYRAIYRLAEAPAGAPLMVTTHLNWRRRLPNRQAGGLANLVQLILTSIGAELGDTLADTVARVHVEMERAKNQPPSLYMILMTALLTPRQIDRLMAQIMKRMPRKPTEVFGAPLFNNVGQVDPARRRPTHTWWPAWALRTTSRCRRCSPPAASASIWRQ